MHLKSQGLEWLKFKLISNERIRLYKGFRRLIWFNLLIFEDVEQVNKLHKVSHLCMSVHSKVSFEVPKDKTLRKAILKFLQNKILNKNSVGSHLNIEHKSNAILLPF